MTLNKKGTSEHKIDRSVGADASRVRALLQGPVRAGGLVHTGGGRQPAVVRAGGDEQRVDTLQRRGGVHHLSGRHEARASLRQVAFRGRQDQLDAQSVVELVPQRVRRALAPESDHTRLQSGRLRR